MRLNHYETTHLIDRQLDSGVGHVTDHADLVAPVEATQTTLAVDLSHTSSN